MADGETGAEAQGMPIEPMATTWGYEQLENAEYEVAGDVDNAAASAKGIEGGEAAVADVNVEGLVPPLFTEGEGSEYFTVDDYWYSHNSMEWMYSPVDGSYFHVQTNTFWIPSKKYAGKFVQMAAYGQEGHSEEYVGQAQGECEVPQEAGQEEQQYTVPVEQYEATDHEEAQNEHEAAAAAVTGAAEEDEEGYLMMDLNADIRAKTAELKGSTEGKTEREDRHVVRELLPLDIVAGSSACCYYSAIFDGHGGSHCAEYCKINMHKNLLGTFRQAKQTIEKKRERQRRIQRRARHGEDDDLGLQYSVELAALRKACQKAFQLTDQNYLNYARRNDYMDGCTALVALLYGPDTDGSLKLVTAHAGDCRAVLCRDDEAIRLTEDHKPNVPTEKKRIEAAGGRVVRIRGVWRVLACVGRKMFGLATARSIGDIHLKEPKILVPSEPDVGVYEVDFERDLFIILGSDGIWDVLTDQDAVNLVLHYTDREQPDAAAKALVDEANNRGSTDDKTATVIFFGWRRDRIGVTYASTPAVGYHATVEGGDVGAEQYDPATYGTYDASTYDKSVVPVVDGLRGGGGNPKLLMLDVDKEGVVQPNAASSDRSDDTAGGRQQKRRLEGFSDLQRKRLASGNDEHLIASSTKDDDDDDDDIFALPKGTEDKSEVVLDAVLGVPIPRPSSSR